MNLRRIGVAAVVLGTMAATGYTARSPIVTPASVFSTKGFPTTPFRPLSGVDGTGPVASTFYCPGIPGIAVPPDPARGGALVITNPTDIEMTASLQILGPQGLISADPVLLGARSQQRVDVGAIAAQAAALYTAVVVEVDGPGALVEQIATSREGSSIAACGNEASNTWYLADGTTLDGANEDLVISNPYPLAASVSVTFATPELVRSPVAFDGFVLPPFSTQAIDVDIISRDEPLVSITVSAPRSRVVVGRSIAMNGSGRQGFSMALGAPSSSYSWFFAAGETGEGITERYVIFNPSDESVDVSVSPYPVEGIAAFDVITRTIGPGLSLSVDLAKEDETAAALGVGRHGVRIDVESLGDVSGIVAERVVTKTVDGGTFTTVVMGSQYLSPVWWVPMAAAGELQNALVISNLDGVDGTFTVNALGPGGLRPIEGLVDVPLGAAETMTIDLVDPTAIGVPIHVVSTALVVVEQLAARGADLMGRTGALTIPE